jgi:hypothetical protein
MSIDDIDDELAAALERQFPDLKGTTSATKSKLLGTRSVQPWYREWRQRQALLKALPDQYADAGFTPAMWAWAVDIKQRRKTVRAEHAEAVKQLALTHKQKVDIADRRRDTDLAASDSPLMQLLEAGYEDLPLAVQAQIAGASDDAARKKMLDSALLRFQQARLRELYTDPDEFAPGVGPAAAGP